MSVIIATAYMEEADCFDWLVATDADRVLATVTPDELHARTTTPSLEDAFVALLPEERRRRRAIDHLSSVSPSTRMLCEVNL